MLNQSLVLGIDLGTTGVRIAIVNNKKELIFFSSKPYINGLENCADWKTCCKLLIAKIPSELKKNIIACSVDGTSGTLLACSYNGSPLGTALPYFQNCHEENQIFTKLFEGEEEANYWKSSLTRACSLINKYGEKILIRHQADWITGWLLSDWSLGEESNNARLGWDPIKKSWPKKSKDLSWTKTLPRVIPSGELLGRISSKRAKELDLSPNLLIISGTTDSNAAVLATDVKENEGVCVLGSTIVVKRFTKHPLKGQGISNHFVGGRWLAGGASNAGCAVLTKIFGDANLSDLSRQINPESNSGLTFLPLPFQGERFPVNDPFLKPILEPRPISDSLYLHGLLEGLARIEAQGWEKLSSASMSKPTKIITIGGGANNPQWRKIRERLIGIPIQTSCRETAEGVARLALKAIQNNYEVQL